MSRGMLVIILHCSVCHVLTPETDKSAFAAFCLPNFRILGRHASATRTPVGRLLALALAGTPIGRLIPRQDIANRFTKSAHPPLIVPLAILAAVHRIKVIVGTATATSIALFPFRWGSRLWRRRGGQFGAVCGVG